MRLPITPSFLYETPEAGSGGGDPTPEAAEPVAPAAGPWSSDLETYFEDEAVRQQADAFLREKIQPHVTRLEQDVSGLADARSLYEDLQENPDETLLSVAAAIYGDEAAEAIAQALNGQEFEDEESDESTDPVEQALPPEVAEVVQEFQATKQREAYEAELTRASQAYGEGFVPEDFAPFVVAADGDIDTALEGYKQFMGRIQQRYQPVEPAVEDPQAPAALGTQATGSVSTPPINKRYDSLDDALDDTLDEMRQAREAPSTVGTV